MATEKTAKQLAQRRYYLHSKIRQANKERIVSMRVRLKALYIDARHVDTVHAFTPYINELRDLFGYTVQTEIR